MRVLDFNIATFSRRERYRLRRNNRRSAQTIRKLIALFLSYVMLAAASPAFVSRPPVTGNTKFAASVGYGPIFDSATARTGFNSAATASAASSLPRPSATEAATDAGRLLYAVQSEGLKVSVGYADDFGPSPNFPSPWQGSSNVIFLGGGTSFDAGAIRIDNPNDFPVSIDSVTVDLQRPGPAFNLWGSFTIPAQRSVILTQTVSFNFDTSNYPIVGCGASPDAGDARVPKVTIKAGGVSTDYLDTAHVLDTGGFNLGCRGNKSLQWRPIGTTGITSLGGRLALSPGASIQPVGSVYNSTVKLSDAADQPLANVTVDFKIISGPNAGKTAQAVTNGQGEAAFSYTSSLQGTDTLQAAVANSTGAALQSNQVITSWTSTDACPPAGPVDPVAATLTYIGPATGEYGDEMSVAALLADGNGSAVAGRSITFALGATTVNAITDADGIARGSVTPLAEPGPNLLTISFAGDGTYSPAKAEATISIDRDETTIRYTGKTMLGTTAPQRVSATLTDDEDHARKPLAGKVLTFEVGSVRAQATTDADGVASATIILTEAETTGPARLSVSFAGDAHYKPSVAGVPVIVYLSTSFVVWGGNPGGLRLGQRVNFWGHSWDDQVQGGDYDSGADFKGFADPVGVISVCQPNARRSSKPPLDSSCWSSKGGQSFPPPVSVPAYIEVIVATSIGKQQNTVYGNIAAAAVLKVDPEPRYDPVPGKPGYGVIVAVIEDGAAIFPLRASIAASQNQPPAVLPGQSFSVTTEVTNNGTAQATAVTVREAFDSLTPPAATADLGAIEPGSSKTATFDRTVPAIGARQAGETVEQYQSRLASSDGRLYTSSATISFSDAVGQPYLPVEVASSSRLQLPRLTVALTTNECVSPAGKIQYKLLVTNIGSATAASATAVLTFPDSTSTTIAISDLASGNSFSKTIEWAIPPISPKGAGESSSDYLARLASNDGRQLVAVARVSWRDGIGNQYGEVDRQATSTQRIPILSVTPQAPDAVVPGEAAKLDFVVQNRGGGNAVQVALSVKNPDGTISRSTPFSLAPGKSSTVQSNWTVPAVPARQPGETETDYRARLVANNSPLSFDVALEWTDAAGGMYGPTSAVAQFKRSIPIVDLTLSNPAAARSGETITYTATATNAGQSQAFNIDLAISLPDGSVQRPQLPARMLAPGASLQVAVNFTIPSTQPNGEMAAQASASWTDVNGNGYGSLSARSVIAISRVNQAPVVSAGADQSIMLPDNRVVLNGTASDDGKPEGSPLSLSWSKVSGPGTVTFANPDRSVTEAAFSAEGIYALRLTASDSEFTSSDEVVITVNKASALNQPPVVDAGADQTITLAVQSGAFFDAASFNAAAGSPPVVANFDEVAPNTNITGANLAGMTFMLGNRPSPSAPLIVVRAADTFTPNGSAANKLTATTGENVLSPGGVQLPAGPNPQVENDDLEIVFDQPVSAIGFDILLQSKDCCSAVGVTVIGISGEILYSNSAIPTGTNAGGGAPAGTLFFGFVSTSANIARIVIDDADGDSIFPDSNIGYDSFRVKAGLAGVATANLNGSVTDDGLPSGSAITAFWSKVSGPGVVSFANASQLSTTATFNAAGTYVLRLSANDTQLTSSDEVTITIESPKRLDFDPIPYLSLAYSPFRLDEGFVVEDFEDHVFNLKGTTASAGGVTSIFWGPTLHDSVDADDGAIDGSGVKGDSYISLSGFAGIKFTFNPAIIGALPTKVGIAWTDGDGPVTFEAFDRQGLSLGVRGPFRFHDNSNNGTTGEDRFFGVYNKDGISAIRISNNGGGIEIDHLQYAFGANLNLPPVVSAGPNQAIVLPNNAAVLNGSVIDDGAPEGGAITVNWAKVSGPGSVSFSDPNQAITTATFSATGTYVLRLTASDSQVIGSADVTVVVSTTSANQAPRVNAGPGQTITLPTNTVSLSGTIADDGLPVGVALTISWSKLSGPGTVIFNSANEAETLAGFSAAGTYVLRLSASDSQLTGFDDVTITVNQPQSNQPPVVNAGADQTIALPTDSVSLSGTVADDGLPTGSAVTLSWSKVSGPGTVTFANANSAATTATFSAAGTYVLRLAAGDGQLTGSDEVTITVNPDPCLPPPPQMVGWWPGDGSYNDLVGANHAAQTGATFTTGKVGQAFSFDGTGSSGLTIPPSPRLDMITAVTIDAWINPASLTCPNVDNSGYCAVIAKDDRTFRNYGLWLRPDGGLHLSYVNGGNIFLDSPAGLIAPGQSSFVAAVIDPANNAMRIYVNGALVASKSTSAPLLANTVPLTIGTSAGGFNFRGWMDEIEIFNRALSGTEIQALFNAGGIGKCKSLGNGWPVVDAGLNQTIAFPDAAHLSGTVTDDGLPAGSALQVSWSKVSGPGTVTFADPSAALTAVTFSATGTYILRLTASDSQLTTSDDVIITVIPASVNRAPVVSAGSDQAITLPANTATLNGTVTDDGLPTGSAVTLSWSKVSGPGTVTFANANSAATTATFSAAGTYVLRLTATDSQLTSFDDVTITLSAAPTNRAPSVSAGPDQSVRLPANTLNLSGTVTDDGLPSGSTLQVSWSKVSGPGTVTFANANSAATTATFSASGVYLLRLTASDGALSASDDLVITVLEPITGPPPTVSILSPADGSEIKTQTNIIGSVSSGAWKLEYSLNTDDGSDNQVWISFASGSGPVTVDALGMFDPTMLLNGSYSIRLSATDASGQSSSVVTSLLVNGNKKVGNFSLSFTDLSVPVAGLPIDVIRTYDSRDKQAGDFGAGWMLGIRSVRLEKTAVLGRSWEQTTEGSFLPRFCIRPTRPHLITITFPDGKMYKFVASTSPQCQPVDSIRFAEMTFTQLPGFTGTQGATLVPLSGTGVAVTGSIPGAIELIDENTAGIYNPTTFKLTTADGFQYVIDQRAGLKSMTDPNGNTLTINNNGIIHSSGKSITFVRDAAGRITRINDPAGNSITYGYDVAGNLISFRDREQNTTAFTYDDKHGLLTIVDPRGIQAIENQYDDSGRLLRSIDADGNPITHDYDLDSNRQVVTDRLGNATEHVYDDDGNLIKRTDPLGGITRFTYDAQGNKTSETNPLGQTSTFTYDTRGNLLSKTDPMGNRFTYTYNGQNKVLTATDPRGNTISFAYDGSGNMVKETGPTGNVTTYTYDARGKRTSETDAAGCIRRFEYDASGNLMREIDALGHATNYTYDVNGNRLSETRSRSVGSVTESLITTFQYDRLNRLVQTTYPDGSSELIEYNAAGLRSAVTDTMQRRTQFEYDEAGLLSRTVFPDGTTESNAYDAEGRRLALTDRAGRTTRFVYDARGLIVQTIYSDGTSKGASYDAVGRVAAVTDERGHTITYEYDAAGRQTKITDAVGAITSFTYDAAGNQLTLTDANNHTRVFTYDAHNRKVKESYPDGTSVVTGYDLLGRVVSKTDQAGKVTRLEYDCAGSLTKVTSSLGFVTAYTYDEVGNRTSQIDAEGRATLFAYDKRGRLIKRTLPRGQSETMSYNAAGNLISKTDPRGNTISYSYDANDNLTQKAFPDGSKVRFTYIASGERASMTDARGTTTYEYDGRDRLLRVSHPDGRVIGYTYDPAGNRISVTTPAGTNTYSYDPMNRLATVTDADGGATAYAYDGAGNRSRMTYPNGSVAEYVYDNLNRLTELTNKKADGSIISRYVYTLGPAGNRLKVSEQTGRTVNYVYDDNYRLVEEQINDPAVGVKNISYTYDKVGNRLSRVEGGVTTTYTYDADDRLLSEGGITYGYDANGNLTSKISPDGEQVAYQYDYENRLVEARTVKGAAATVAGYHYDADGNRLRKDINGVPDTGYLVDSNLPNAQVLVEYNGSGAPRAAYVYGDDLISMEQEGVTSYYHYDGQLSTRQLTNGAQVVTDEYVYDAFGRLLSSTGSTRNSYLYTGEQFDHNVGFYYLRARYYSPNSGRFISQDDFEGDIFEPASLHKYVYTKNDPVNLIDPTGHFAEGLAALNVSIGIGGIITNIMPHMVKAAVVVAGLKLIVEPGVEMRNLAISLMASGRLGTEGWRAALKMYERGGQIIEAGTQFIGLGVKTVDAAFATYGGVKTLVNLGLGFRDMASAISRAVTGDATSATFSVRTNEAFKHVVTTFIQLEANGAGLLIKASGVKAPEVTALRPGLTNWMDLMRRAQMLFNELNKLRKTYKKVKGAVDKLEQLNDMAGDISSDFITR